MMSVSVATAKLDAAAGVAWFLDACQSLPERQTAGAERNRTHILKCSDVCIYPRRSCTKVVEIVTKIATAEITIMTLCVCDSDSV